MSAGSGRTVRRDARDGHAGDLDQPGSRHARDCYRCMCCWEGRTRRGRPRDRFECSGRAARVTPLVLPECDQYVDSRRHRHGKPAALGFDDGDGVRALQLVGLHHGRRLQLSRASARSRSYATLSGPVSRLENADTAIGGYRAETSSTQPRKCASPAPQSNASAPATKAAAAIPAAIAPRSESTG